MCCVCCRKRKKKLQSKVKSDNETSDINKSYERLENLNHLDDTESTQTNSSSSITSSNETKTISLISKKSNDSINLFEKPGFILVQPVQYDKAIDANNSNTHTLDPRHMALVPAYQHLPKIVNDQINSSKYNSQFNPNFENNNLLQMAEYRAPSPKTLDESVKIISKLIELNSRNLVNDHHPYQQDRSINELTVNQRKPKLIKQNSSQYSSFDYE